MSPCRRRPGWGCARPPQRRRCSWHTPTPRDPTRSPVPRRWGVQYTSFTLVTWDRRWERCRGLFKKTSIRHTWMGCRLSMAWASAGPLTIAAACQMSAHPATSAVRSQEARINTLCYKSVGQSTDFAQESACVPTVRSKYAIHSEYSPGEGRVG